MILKSDIIGQENVLQRYRGIRDMEIERKFTIKQLPANLEEYPSHHIEQAYICTAPVLRVRREDDDYILTYKGSGMLEREEHNFALNKEAYQHLLAKADGNIISKKRYLIPLANPMFQKGFPAPPADYQLTIELDVFSPPFAPLVMAEVEFGSREAAEAFIPPAWFDEDVTFRQEYHNSYMALQS